MTAILTKEHLKSKICYWFDLYHDKQINERELERFLTIDILSGLGEKKE